MIWFTEDDRGGWLDLETRLRREGLKLDGSQVPKALTDVNPWMGNLIRNAQQQGIDVPSPPSTPLSYTELMEKLLHQGVLSRP